MKVSNNMTEIHEDYGPSYSYSDLKKGDPIDYRLEGHTEHGEILWVAVASTLSSGQHFPPHYVVIADGNTFPDMVLFSDLVMDAEPTMEYCQWCLGMHLKGAMDQCPLNPNRKV